jgi:predicted tellurium resistance membrane protein TerC
MLELLTQPETYVSLLVLAAMEIVLGIDNIVFITILTGRLPREDQHRARRLGLAVALISRLLLLSAIAWIMRLTEPLFHLVVEWSGKDLILAGGGVFLLYKATREIYENVEQHEAHAHAIVSQGPEAPRSGASRRDFASIVLQIMVLDIVFSLDSVITAVGMVEHLPIMIAAVVIAVIVMMIFAGPVGDFVQAHPSIRVLALAFLVLIGVMLIVEATGQHVSKGYIYSAMGFSLFVQILNMRMQARAARAGDRDAETPGA